MPAMSARPPEVNMNGGPVRPDIQALLDRGMLGRFKLIKLLGEGAMASVLLAEDTALRRQVALKVLPVADTPEQRVFLKQFVKEAQSAAQLVHHAIVQVFQVGIKQDHAYIAMELIDGPDLRRVVRDEGPLPVDRACGLIAEAAEGLAYAHELGVLHRDIKPANLVRTARGRCKICDFGVAQMADPTDPSGGGGFKLPYNVVGTPYYLSPEAARGQASPASDVWGLSATLWHMLAGQPPYAVRSLAEARGVGTVVPLGDLASLRPDLPGSLADVLTRALDPTPANRLDDADALAKAIRPFAVSVGDLAATRAGDGKHRATPSSWSEAEPSSRAPRTMPHEDESRLRHHRIRVLGVLALIAVTAVAGLGYVLLKGSLDTEPATVAHAGGPGQPPPADPTPPVQASESREPVERKTPSEPTQAMDWSLPIVPPPAGLTRPAVVEPVIPVRPADPRPEPVQPQQRVAEPVESPGPEPAETARLPQVIETISATDQARLQSILLTKEDAVYTVEGVVARVGPVRDDIVLLYDSAARFRVRMVATDRFPVERSLGVGVYELPGRRVAVTGVIRPLASRDMVPEIVLAQPGSLVLRPAQ